MATYRPDKWVVVRLVPTTSEGTPHYRVFASWIGGYAVSDSWKFNSGITEAKEDESHFFFHGESGSVYQCHKGSYGTSMYGSSVLEDFRKRLTGFMDIVMMEEDTNWLTLDYT